MREIFGKMCPISRQNFFGNGCAYFDLYWCWRYDGLSGGQSGTSRVLLVILSVGWGKGRCDKDKVLLWCPCKRVKNSLTCCCQAVHNGMKREFIVTKGVGILEGYSCWLRPDYLDQIYVERGRVACARGASSDRDCASGLRRCACKPRARPLGAGDHRALWSMRSATGARLYRYSILEQGAARRDPGAGTTTRVLFACARLHRALCCAGWLRLRDTQRSATP